VLSKHLQDRNICLTGDLATVMSNTKGFLVISAHYLDGNFQLSSNVLMEVIKHFVSENNTVTSVTLGAKYLPLRHTGANIASALSESLANFSIREDQIVGGCTDGGQNMINGMKIVLENPETHNICMCHLFATIVRHVMKSLDDQLTCLSQIQNHAYHLKMSSVAMEDFRQSQYAEGATENSVKKLKISVSTRWNSSYLSAVAYLELKHHVNYAASRDLYKGPVPLNREAEKVLEDYVSVMKPIYEATKELSGDLYLTGDYEIISVQSLNLYKFTTI
jgi:hypothetical protein